jgi:predicted metal-dependent TIM-barrel fold hydrolase
MITGFERFRAGQEALAEAVIEALPRFLVKEGVVAMGELGYDEQTPLEDKARRYRIHSNFCRRVSYSLQ